MTPTLSTTCELCHGENRVPDPEWTGEMMHCPCCAESDGTSPDDSPDGAAALEPVYPLDLWAVSEDESHATQIPLTFPRSTLPIARTVATVAARNRTRDPVYWVGEIRICDAVGEVFGRVPIRAA